MKFLAHQSTVWIIVLACAPLFSAHAQTAAGSKGPLASVSGKITVKEKGLADVIVVLTRQNPSQSSASTYRARTDQDGKYRITNVPAGSYSVSPETAVYVCPAELKRRALIIGGGENIEDIDFDLVRGAVVTGKITDSDGRPLIEESVTILPAADPNMQSYSGESSRVINSNMQSYSGGSSRSVVTDDR